MSLEKMGRGSLCPQPCLVRFGISPTGQTLWLQESCVIKMLTHTPGRVVLFCVLPFRCPAILSLVANDTRGALLG